MQQVCCRCHKAPALTRPKGCDYDNVYNVTDAMHYTPAAIDLAPAQTRICSKQALLVTSNLVALSTQ